MKIVKRLNVFETNSSSTHTVDLLYKDLNTEWRKTEDIPDGEREIRTPLNKLIMALGIIDNITYSLTRKTEAKLLRKILVEVYIEKFGNNKELDLILSHDDNNHCLNFFNEDNLDDCNCSLCHLNKLKKALHITKSDSLEEEFRKGAEYLYNPDVYFLLKEGWYGGFWEIDKSVF